MNNLLFIKISFIIDPHIKSGLWFVDVYFNRAFLLFVFFMYGMSGRSFDDHEFEVFVVGSGGFCLAVGEEGVGGGVLLG